MPVPENATKIMYERWFRVRCPEKLCLAWTYTPAHDLPDFVVCVLCRFRIPMKDLIKTGVEFKRR